MSQRKAKEYRQAMEQYHGVVEDVDDLKRRIGAMEARHNREDQLAAYQRRKARREWEEFQAQQAEREERQKRRRQEERRRQIARQRIAVLALAILAVIVMLAMAIKATSDAKAVEYTPTATPVVDIQPETVAVLSNLWDGEGEGEDPMEAEKIEAALLAQGYLSDAVPLPYYLQDIMRTACREYGCPYSLALAVAEVESHFDMDAVGAAGEVGIMQLNPGPENTYWINLEAETNQDPTTPAGNIVCGVYLLGTHLANYQDMEKAIMAYNMGNAGAEQAWENGITSTEYSTNVLAAVERWECTVNAWAGE